MVIGERKQMKLEEKFLSVSFYSPLIQREFSRDLLNIVW
jgi:hypothetical protein